MRLLLAIALACAPGVAHAQFPPDGFGTVYVPRGPSFSFTAPAAGTYATLTATTQQTITCTRASSATYQPTATTVATATTNQCAVDVRGLQVEGGGTNVLLRSGDLSNAAWSNDGVTVLANQAVAPDATTTMAKVTYVSGGGGMYQQATFTSSTGPFATSAWFRQVDSSNKRGFIRAFCSAGTAATCTCSRQDHSACTTAPSGGTCSAWSDFASIDRFQLAWSCTSAITAGNTQEFGAGQYSVGTGSIYVWGAQSEQGTPFATSYIATAGTTAARAADAVTLSKPSNVTLASQDFSMSVTAQLEGTSTALQQVAMGSDQNVLPFLRTEPSVGNIDGKADNGSLATFAYADANKVNATKYTLQRAAPNKVVCAAGACGTPVALGSAPSEPSTLYLGASFSGSVYGQIYGWISAACLSRTSTGCAP